MRLLFVCFGNICRSPIAEAAMRSLAGRSPGGIELDVASAGTSARHVGRPRHHMAIEAAARAGFEVTGSGRQFGPGDFDEFDLIVALDRRNRDELIRLAPGPEAERKVRLLREWDPQAVGELDVADPYGLEAEAFDEVVEQVERSCRVLFEEIAAGPDAP